MAETQSPDTSPDVERAMFDRYRAMSDAQKLQAVAAIGAMVNAFARARIRRGPSAHARSRLPRRLLQRRPPFHERQIRPLRLFPDGLPSTPDRTPQQKGRRSEHGVRDIRGLGGGHHAPETGLVPDL